jgi:hypothetical protein
MVGGGEPWEDTSPLRAPRGASCSASAAESERPLPETPEALEGAFQEVRWVYRGAHNRGWSRGIPEVARGAAGSLLKAGPRRRLVSAGLLELGKECVQRDLGIAKEQPSVVFVEEMILDAGEAGGQRALEH